MATDLLVLVHFVRAFDIGQSVQCFTSRSMKLLK